MGRMGGAGRGAVTVELVTPEQARRWIRHSHQRSIDLLKCRRILEAAGSGHWNPTLQVHSPVIVLQSRGVIADGHHRMIAILMHGKPLECVVEYREG